MTSLIGVSRVTQRCCYILEAISKVLAAPGGVRSPGRSESPIPGLSLNTNTYDEQANCIVNVSVNVTRRVYPNLFHSSSHHDLY